MSQENVDKTTDFIDAYNRRDFDAATRDFDPEVDWVLPEHQSSDSCKGLEEIKRFWQGLDETFEELRLEPQESVDGGTAWRCGFASTGGARGAGWRWTPRCTTRSPRSAME
jgi:ketosteroid isomerase-like protein